MILGIYFLTIENPLAEIGKGKVFASENEAVKAYELRVIETQAEVHVRRGNERVKTTVGRIIFNMTVNDVLTRFQKEPCPYVNENVGKKTLSKLINGWYTQYGSSVVAELCDTLKDLGYKYATKCGLTIAIGDLQIPAEKKSDCVEFLNTLKPEKLLLSHTDVWPVLFYHAAKLVPGGLIWLPQKNVPLSFIKKLFLVPWLKLHILRFPEWKSPFKSFFVGNPRVSRILSRIENKINLKKLHILEAFYAEPVKGKFNLIIGSAWFEDLEVLSRALNLLTPAENLQWNIVVIPHDPQDSHEVARMKQVLPKGRILLEEGILLEAYEGFDLAFVGGGFGLGLHNIIEPALWKIPTLCGPYIDKQPEASWLRDLGQLVILNGAEDLAEELRNLLSEKYRILRKDACDTAYQKLLEHKDSINRLISCLKGV
jgi:3-deoxy-D-manno-octulosonic-acid transferase